MITFSDYRNDTPTVYFSVGKYLNEELGVETQHFLGDPKNAPPTKAILPGIYNDDTSEEGYVHYRNDGTKLHLKNIDSAEMFAATLKRSHDKKLQALNKTLESHYHEASVHPIYSKHIEKYTNEAGINDTLLNGDDLSEEDAHHIKHLDQALTHTKTPDDMVLYSGTSLSHAKELRRKDVVHHPSYVSTSLTVNKAMDFASRKNGDLVELHVPKDHPGMYIDHISDYSEREFLLPRDLKFRIHRDKEKVLITPSRTFTVHYATIEK